MPSPIPSPDYLHSILTYEDGFLRWKPRQRDAFQSDRAWKVWNAKFANKLTGQRHTMGYRQLMIDGVRLLEHRVIAAMHGMSLDHCIDHIDGNTINNKIENLRPATQAQNTRNNTGWAKKKEPLGVHKRPHGKFVAYIRVNGTHKHLGTYFTEAEATAARIAAERLCYGSFSSRASRENQ